MPFESARRSHPTPSSPDNDPTASSPYPRLTPALPELCFGRTAHNSVLFSRRRSEVVNTRPNVFHSLLGIPLHLRIERRIDFQPIGINIILGSVSLHIFLAPTIQRIIRPSNGIVYEFLSFPPPIFRFHRLFAVIINLNCSLK